MEISKKQLAKMIDHTLIKHTAARAARKFAKEAGADFVKASTGFVGGATVEDVRLMRETVGRDMGSSWRHKNPQRSLSHDRSRSQQNWNEHRSCHNRGVSRVGCHVC